MSVSRPKLILSSIQGLTEPMAWRDVFKMDESDFEGTLVLEKIAEINKVDDFFEAIDSDDFNKATSLMKRANVDSEVAA